MGESNKSGLSEHEQVIAAFDRECDLARELNRRHTEHVRNSRRDDQQTGGQTRRRPR